MVKEVLVPRWFVSWLCFVVVIGVAARSVAAVCTFDDGGTHVIADGSCPFGATVGMNLGPATTLIVKPGAAVGTPVYVLGTSLFQMEGGTLAGFVEAGGAAGTIKILGGSIGTQVVAFGDARAEVYGGTMPELMAIVGGTAELHGGTVTGHLTVGGGATMRVYGTGFNYPFGLVTDGTGTLSGTLADGSPLSVPFEKNFRGAGTLELLAVPEPGGIVGMVIGLGVVVVARRRRGARE